MFAFGRIVNYTKASVSWQQPRFFFSSSTKAANHWSKIPEIRRKQYDRQNASWREQYAQDKAFREKRAKQSLESKRALSAYESYVRRRRNAFFKWVISSLNRGVRRTWPTHTPEISLVNKTRRCTECDFDRHKTLWWKRNGTHDSFDCNVCFVKDWSRVRLTGYEHKEYHSRRPVKSEQKPDTPSDETPEQVKSSTESRP